MDQELQEIQELQAIQKTQAIQKIQAIQKMQAMQEIQAPQETQLLQESCGRQYEQRIKIYRRMLILTAILGLAAMGAGAFKYYRDMLPDELNLRAKSEASFDFSLPASAYITVDTAAPAAGESNGKAESLRLNFARPFTIRSGESGSYLADVRLFGMFSLKQISIGIVDQMELSPGGTQVGIYLETDGLLVLGTAGITDAQGNKQEPCLDKLYSGDYILAVNGVRTPRKELLQEEIEKNSGQVIRLLIRREEQELTISVTPVIGMDGSVRIGAWIRDDTQGIGTLTYISPNGTFGALGHGIADVDTGLLMEIGGGDLYDTTIIGIIKGKKGTPGSISGIVQMSEEEKLGRITANTGQGIFGQITNYQAEQETLPVGLKQEVKMGEAGLLSAVDGTLREYKIRIEAVDISGKSPNKGLVLRVIDERLIELTGGIIQGMSGSPIIQDGKLVGAVTHVLVNDPTRGYGIFIENMLEAAD